MNAKQRECNRIVARSIDAPLRALPIIPELFAPLCALGSTPRRIVRWLSDAGLSERSRLLDLGCGKGAVSVAAAARLKCRTLGIDAFEPFIVGARDRAQRRGVENRCRFEVGRIADAHHYESENYRSRRRKKSTRLWDAALILGVCGIAEGSALCRGFVRRGGVYVLDDAVRISKSRDVPDDTPDLDAARWLLERDGDRIEREFVPTRTEALRHENRLYQKLSAQAERMIRRNPERRALLRECLRRQREAIRIMTGPLRPAIWLVRRG